MNNQLVQYRRAYEIVYSTVSRSKLSKSLRATLSKHRAVAGCIRASPYQCYGDKGTGRYGWTESCLLLHKEVEEIDTKLPTDIPISYFPNAIEMIFCAVPSALDQIFPSWFLTLGCNVSSPCRFIVSHSQSGTLQRISDGFNISALSLCCYVYVLRNCNSLFVEHVPVRGQMPTSRRRQFIWIEC